MLPLQHKSFQKYGSSSASIVRDMMGTARVAGLGVLACLAVLHGARCLGLDHDSLPPDLGPNGSTYPSENDSRLLSTAAASSDFADATPVGPTPENGANDRAPPSDDWPGFSGFAGGYPISSIRYGDGVRRHTGDYAHDGEDDRSVFSSINRFFDQLINDLI